MTKISFAENTSESIKNDNNQSNRKNQTNDKMDVTALMNMLDGSKKTKDSSELSSKTNTTAPVKKTVAANGESKPLFDDSSNPTVLVQPVVKRNPTTPHIATPKMGNRTPVTQKSENKKSSLPVIITLVTLLAFTALMYLFDHKAERWVEASEASETESTQASLPQEKNSANPVVTEFDKTLTKEKSKTADKDDLLRIISQ